MKRFSKVIRILLWAVGIWAALLVAIEIALSSSTATGIVNRYAAEYVDGDLSFGRISVSTFRHFPTVSLTLEDFSITYPSDRFDHLEATGPQGHLLYKGCGAEADTLASFSRFSASMKILPLIAGKISIPRLELVKPRIFAHVYGDGSANWDIFRFPEDTVSADEDKSSGLPDITIGRLALSDRPHIVFTDSRDTLFAMINLRRAGLEGRLTTGKTSRNRIDFTLDSMLVAGRLAADTIAFRLDQLHVHEHRQHMDFHAQAKTNLATHAFGRMQIPIEMEGSLRFPKDTVPAFAVEDLRLEVASVPIKADADIRLMDGRTGINGTVGIDRCKVSDVMNGFVKNIVPAVCEISTDAEISLTADISGYYDHATGKLPDIQACLSVPQTAVSHKDFSHSLQLGLEATAGTDSEGRIDMTLKDLNVSTIGLALKAEGGVKDVLGQDPSITLDGKVKADFDSLSVFIPDTLGIESHGALEAGIKGNIRMSQMDMYNFSRTELTGSITGDSLILRSVRDTIDANIQGLSVTLGPEERVMRRDSTRTRRLMAVTGKLAKADITYKEDLKINAEKLVVSAKNSMSSDTSRINPLRGTLEAKTLSVRDASASSVRLDNTVNSFTVRPKRGHPKVPVLSLSSNNKRITLAAQNNRAILTDAGVKATAAMNTVERASRRNEFLDSLAKVYPDIPKDSLFRHSRAQRAARPLPDWLSEEDFREKDIDIRLDESLAKYFREWDLSGDVDIRTGIIMTPYFPLRNIIRGFEVHFNNDEIGIDSAKVMTGKSEIAAKGTLSGLKRALAGRGRNRSALKLDLDITSDGMDANELLKAYTVGARYNPENAKEDMAEVSNSEFLQMVIADTTAAEEAGSSLFVIPANIVADISIDASGIKYSELDINSLKAQLLMKERCVQITNTSASSNMGGITFDAFYSTRTKEDLKTGFSLNFEDITAERVIALMPAADTLVPMLKSFKGLLNCEIAATAQLDTNMNILTPSINGVMRISGDDLSLSDNELFRTLAKKLFFKNKKEGKIDKMVVEGLIKDNTFEIFPFVMKVDRYTLAMSGVQNLDMSFRYHVSVLRSPFLIRLGIDLSGPDFDNMKFRIGRAKYKSTKVPVFSSVIDETRINLVESIRSIFSKGVEAAIRENERQEVIAGHKQEIGYIQAVDLELEELSAEEAKQLEADEAAAMAEEEAAVSEGAETESETEATIQETTKQP